MRSRPRHVHEEPGINLIPLINVLLMILIFLMITTTYSRYTEPKVDLLTAEAKKATERPGQIVMPVTADGVYSVDKQVLDTRNVTSLVDTLRNVAGKAGGPEPVVIVSADTQAAHQTVINVMGAARVAGLSHLTFATQTGNTR